MNKHRTKKPPKPALKEPLKPARKHVGKENSDGVLNKSHGGTKGTKGIRSVSQQDQVACHKDIRGLKDSDARLSQDLGRALNTAMDFPQGQGQSIDMLDSAFAFDLPDSHNSTGRYTSQGKSQARKKGITGRRVDQPRVVVVAEPEPFDGGRPALTSASSVAMRKPAATKSKTVRESARSQGMRGYKAKRMTDFLDASITQPQLDQNLTLNILTHTMDNMGERPHLESGKDKPAKTKQRPSSQERSKVQMKYLAFQRDNVLKSRAKSSAGAKKRSATAMNPFQKDVNRTQSISAERATISSGPSPNRSTGATQIIKRTEREHSSEGKRKRVAQSALEVADHSIIVGGERDLNNKSDFSIAGKLTQPQKSVQYCHTNKSLTGLVNRDLKNQSTMMVHKKTSSPPRGSRIDQIIKASLRKQGHTKEERLKERKDKEETSLKRRKLLEQKNSHIRQLNREKVQRRKQREKTPVALDRMEGNDTTMLGQALLAVSDGMQKELARRFNSEEQDEFRAEGIQTQKHFGLRNLRVKDEAESHRRSQGMDFIEIRKEISSELRTIDQKLKQTAKVSKKDLVIGRTINAEQTPTIKTSKSLKQDFVPLRIRPSAPQTTQHKLEGGPLKRDKIRRFMKNKAKEIQSKMAKQRQKEICTAKKVQDNLSKLNSFVQKRVWDRNSGATTPAVRSRGLRATNQYNLHVKRNTTIVQHPREEDLTHEKQVTPNKGLFENSEASLNISGKNSRLVNRSVLAKHQAPHDTLYEDSRISSIQTIEHDAQKRRHQANNSALGVCFERSASSKVLRNQIRHSQSPIEMPAKRVKRRPTSAMAHTSKGKKPKVLPKRPKTALNNSRIKMPAKGRLTVRVPDGHLNESIDSQREMTLNLRLDDQSAAIIIQKEVRKFLSNLGFYEARPDGEPCLQGSLDSPNGGTQISLFIEPRNPSRDRSGSSKKRSSGNYRSSNRRSPDYELVNPASGSKNMKIKLSPTQIRKINDIPELAELSPESKVLNRSGKSASQKNFSSPSIIQDEQEQSPTKLDEEDIRRAADRKRASEEVTQSKMLSLIQRYPLSKEGFNLNALKDYIGSSNSSNGPPVWGVTSVATPQSSRVPDPSRILNGLPLATSPHNKSDMQAQGPLQIPIDAASQSSQSLFERNAFQQFSNKQLAQLMKNNEYKRLIRFREDCLQFREQRERKHIKQLLRKNQLTPRSYSRKQEQIERWVQVERAELEKTKSAFKEEWEKTVTMVEETQRGIDSMRHKLHTDSNSYSQASSRQQNNRPTRSLLLEEGPKSYRSGSRQDPIAVHEEDGLSQQDLEGHGNLLTFVDKRFSGPGLDPLSGKKASHSEVKAKSGRQKDDRPVGFQTEGKKAEKDDESEPEVGDNDAEPSAEFLQRLERAANGLLQDSAEGTLNIEEHSFAEEPGLLSDEPVGGDAFEDGGSKNRVVQIKDISSLLDQDGTPSASDGKSEPALGTKEDLKISDMLREKDDLRKQLNVDESGGKDLSKEPQVVSERLVPAVTKPVPPSKSLQDDKYKMQLTDQITDELIKTMLGEAIAASRKTKGKEAKKEEEKQEPDVFLVDGNQMDREEKREWIELRQRHLIEGELIRVDSYVNELVDVLLQFEISDVSEGSQFDYEVRSQDNFHIQFLKLLTQPIARSGAAVLKQMQTSELGSYEHFETSLEASKHPIVPVDLYLEIEKAREETMIARKGKKAEDPKTAQMWESVHIFNKAIFDAVNESLMKFRPYGLVGAPMPWSNKVRRLQTKVDIVSVDTERLFQMVKQEVFRWTQVFCGCLPSPVFHFPNTRTGKDEFSEEMYQEVREKRLTTILSQETVEQEHHWLNYEFEEAQVKIDISDMILETLVGELVGFLQHPQRSESSKVPAITQLI